LYVGTGSSVPGPVFEMTRNVPPYTGFPGAGPPEEELELHDARPHIPETAASTAISLGSGLIGTLLTNPVPCKQYPAGDVVECSPKPIRFPGRA